MRRLSFLLIVVVASLGWATDPSPEPDDDNDAKAILGSWQAVKVVTQGRTAPAAEIAAMKMIVMKDKFSVTGGIGKDSRQVGVLYKLDMKAKPSAIDMAMERNKKVTMQGIYKIEKGELTLLLREPGGTRPKSFDEKTGNIQVYRKVEAAK